jgi:hypothetical protein
MSIDSAKKSRGRPPADTTAVNVRIDRALLDRVDEFAAHHRINRPEAVRRLLIPFLDYDRHSIDGLDPLVIGLTLEEKIAIDAWSADQADAPSRFEAVRRLVEKGLSSE